MNTDELCFIVTGDLAFFYDMNALGIRHIKNNVRVLLINNCGGAEFKIMTRNWRTKVSVDEFISANGHNGSAKGWAENSGFRYIGATTKEEVNKSVSVFTQNSDKPILMEVFTSEDKDRNAIDAFLSANSITTAQGKMAKIVTSIVGESGKQVIKKVLGKS